MRSSGIATKSDIYLLILTFLWVRSVFSADNNGYTNLAFVVPHDRQISWQKREFEVLIHFGINTFTGKEWGSGREDPGLFNPTAVDCDQWVRAAKAAGANGIVFVCKHHDGFCLWPSKFTSYSIKSSPWKFGKGDVVGDIAAACKRQSLAFGIYISPADLHEASSGRSSRSYNELFVNQLTELLMDYGDISLVFFDGATPSGVHYDYDYPRYYSLIRRLSPNAVIAIRGPDVRWVGNESGFARQSEWSVVAVPRDPLTYDWPDMTSADLGSRQALQGASFLHWYPAVADVSLRHSWFWQPDNETTIKSLTELLAIYEASVGRNSGLQLNVAPDRDGKIPKADFERLTEFGNKIRSLFEFDLLSNSLFAPIKWDSETDCHQVVTLDKPRRISYIVLQEDISKGQMVEEVEIFIVDTNGNTFAFSSSTIGWKRILYVNVDNAKSLLWRVKKSRGHPSIVIKAF